MQTFLRHEREKASERYRGKGETVTDRKTERERERALLHLIPSSLTCSSHVFTGVDGLESNKWDLHGHDQSHNVEGRVGYNHSIRTSAHQEQDKNVKRN